MFNKSRENQFKIYNSVRRYFLAHPEYLIKLEKYFSDKILELLKKNLDSIVSDYNEASKLYPFWQNYPPDERGRSPKGDQFPWIEVGEHSIGVKLIRLLAEIFKSSDPGLPTGPDQRIVLTHPIIKKMTGGLTNCIWLMIDIKSTGPRDDFGHTVMSHNQISGDGNWDKIENGVSNTVLKATGVRNKHLFHATLPPIYILSDGTIAPVIIFALKPTYKMLALDGHSADAGQPLKKITLISIPNGLLLTKTPGYLKKYPSLLFPGKDDRDKNPLKIRARISFDILKRIDDWRVKTLEV
ncbi:MAG: BglI family type II restriction endonuclease [Candidatus Komeilibacteria bacterium]